MEAGPSFSALFVETTFFAPFEGITTLAKSSPAFAFFLPATLAGCTFRVFGNLQIDKAAVHLEFVEGLKYKIGKLGIRIEKGETFLGIHIENVLLFELQGIPEEIL